MARVLCLMYILLALGCQSAFEFEGLPDEVFLVVDGQVSTKKGQSRVVLSGSTNFNEESQFGERYADAIVTVIDEIGNEHTFSNINNGNIYFEPTEFMAEVGKSYRLNIEWRGKTIISGFEKIRRAVSFSLDTIRTKEGGFNSINQPTLVVGHDIITRLSTPEVDSSFLKWSWQEFYEHPYTYVDVRKFVYGEFNLNRIVITENLTDIFIPVNISSNNFTWSEPIGFVIDSADLEEDDYLGELNAMTVDVIIDSLTTINDSSPVKYYLYEVVVHQSSMTPSSFDYWQKILNQGNNTGSIFDQAPTTILGNVRSTEGEDIVLGNFSAIDELEETIYIEYRVVKTS